MTDTETVCIPNINLAARRRRLASGVFSLIVAFVFLLALFAFDIPRIWRLAVFAFFLPAAYGYFQFSEKT